MAGKSQHQHQSHQKHQHQHQPQERILQASYLIPSYQKALPHALLHECSGDYRLRKIEATCSCKIGWGRLPTRLAERYSLLQIAFDPKRGNYLGALNLLRQYFLGNAALIPFHQTLLRPNGSQVTKNFPTAVDDCRLLMPQCDRFGRAVVELSGAAAVSEAANVRSEVCTRLADRLTESGLRCLAMHAAFLESEAATVTPPRTLGDMAETEAEAEEEAAAVAAAEAAVAAAAASEAELAYAAETVAQCELCRVCVCALVEAAEATRLLERLDESRHRRSSLSPSRRRIDFRLSPARQQQQHQHQHQQPPLTTARQANNHHRPTSRSRDRRQSQHQHQHQQPRQYRNNNHDHPEESCATTLADVEAITFAESEYVDKPRPAIAEPMAASGGASSGQRASAPANQPESLLLCGLQPSAASALSALDRSDRRLKTVERRTGCRLELRERRCAGGGGEGGAGMTSQQMSYAIQLVPQRPDARPRGCVNMLRSLLHRLDPSYRFCVVSATDAANEAARRVDRAPIASSALLRQRRRSPLLRCCRSTSAAVTAAAAAAASAAAATTTAAATAAVHRMDDRRRHRSRRLLPQPRWRTVPPPSPVSPAQINSMAVVACASRLVRLAVADCVLGASATAAAGVAACAGISGFRRRLELRREAVLSDALICVFRSLTASDADARLLSEALDSGGGCDAGDATDATETEEFCIVRDAVNRTLITCAAERCVRGFLGAFACLPPPELAAAASASDSASFAADGVSATTSVRRRLARLTLDCWERLCSGALCSDAGLGAGVLLEAVTAEAATEVAIGQLTRARLTLDVRCAAAADEDNDGEAAGDVKDKDVNNGGSCSFQQQRRRRRRRRSQRIPSALRRPLSVLAAKRLLADKLEAAVTGRVSLAAVLTHLAVELVTEQVWNACLKTQLMLRLRLRPS